MFIIFIRSHAFLTWESSRRFATPPLNIGCFLDLVPFERLAIKYIKFLHYLNKPCLTHVVLRIYKKRKFQFCEITRPRRSTDIEFSAVKLLTTVEVSFNHYQERLLSLPISQPIHQATKTMNARGILFLITSFFTSRWLRRRLAKDWSH